MNPVKLITVLLLFYCSWARAQQIPPKQWLAHMVDSLYHCNVDTLIYYHQYCSECDVKSSDMACLIRQNGYTEIANIILYKQGKCYFALYFDCHSPAYKKKLGSGDSFQYFASIIPLLQSRDETIKAIYHQHRFLPPVATDGLYREAVLYHKATKYHVAVSRQQQSEDYKVWKPYFWIDKEIALLKMIDDDLFDTY